jgi:hypothetical protein
MRTKSATLGILLTAFAIAPAARPTQSANREFNNYVAAVETRLLQEESQGNDLKRPLPADGIHTEPVQGGSWRVSGGLLHHWRGAALVPGVSAKSMLALMRDHGHYASYYRPEVVSSRSLAVAGDQATILMRFRKQTVITVVLDAEFATRSALVSARRGHAISRSTHIWQISEPGSDREHRLPEGDDDGFLWRLNSYWSFEETPEGLLIACEAVSLTRDVPAALGWLITPIVHALPRNSLEFTMTATAKALMANAARRRDDDREE